MIACTFFGHSLITKEFRPRLKMIIEELINTKNVDMFYVGNKGDFDAGVISILKDISKIYPIQYRVVLAYMPKRHDYLSNENTILPEGIEYVFPRFAISWRNKWMVEKSDYVICYIERTFGGAAKFVDMAIKKNKMVINVAEQGPEL